MRVSKRIPEQNTVQKAEKKFRLFLKRTLNKRRYLARSFRAQYRYVCARARACSRRNNRNFFSEPALSCSGILLIPGQTKTPALYAKDEGIISRVTTFFHTRLTPTASSSTKNLYRSTILPHDNVCRDLSLTSVAAYSQMLLVRSSKTYSLQASPAPLISRQLSVGFSDNYLFFSQLMSRLQRVQKTLSSKTSQTRLS